uniref:Histone deacetylase 6-like isoform X1 n=2 Tax=Crassostrea virginica TaxID=6565 RepID=A0A8B8AZ71_CRAVI|nr:histone deacetylase 6-like isoform X1 [Crassostrea virginica]XP_022296456.1 histone deacetylase 6-like isoform X1 [Crassostrea virginica]XP_022296457.1 histone deacetylase 6-like isoform X1 [Crassostrea virginica]
MASASEGNTLLNRTGVVYNDLMASHFHMWNEEFTEKPERYTSIVERCKQYGLLDRCAKIQSREATDEEILTLHNPDHLKILKMSESMSKEEMETLSQKYDYLYFHKDILRNSRLALGATLNMVDEVLNGKVRNGFAIVRPPGHHAMYNEFNGYCLLNNVALGAKRALDQHGLERVLIIDWDVHHGQGIQYFFYDDPRVMYFSIHKYLDGEEWPYLRESDYDYIGEGPGTGFNVNVPLNVIGCGDSVYMAILFNILLPIAYEFNPQLILISAGYDAALGCPEGEMEVTPGCFAQYVNLLSPLAEGKLCLVLEGGYCIKTLSEGVALSLKALLGDPCPRLEPISTPQDSAVLSILNVIKVLRPYWRSLQLQGDLASITHNQRTGVLTWPPKEGVTFYTHSRPESYSLHQECWNPGVMESAQVVDVRVDELLARTVPRSTKHKVGIVYEEAVLNHRDTGFGGFEECPERVERIVQTLKKNGTWERCFPIQGRKASDDELCLAHGEDHIRRFKKTMTMGEEALKVYQSSFKSIYLCQESFTSAAWAVGCSLSVIDSILTNQCQSGAAIIRPPGHHAERNDMMGFCLFNNVGIAAKYAQQKHAVQRILIVDWDIHHGNALQNLFEDDPSVLYVSLHRFDNGSFYPYGGKGFYKQAGGPNAQGRTVNIAWNDGSKGDADYISAFHSLVLPIAYEFAPELVIVAAGFDAEKTDPLGGYRLSPAVFGHMTRMLMGLADGKVALILEGGYSLEGTAQSMSLCISALLGDPLPAIHNTVPSKSGVEAICKTMEVQEAFWKTLLYRVELPTQEQLEVLKSEKEQKN